MKYILIASIIVMLAGCDVSNPRVYVEPHTAFHQDGCSPKQGHEVAQYEIGWIDKTLSSNRQIPWSGMLLLCQDGTTVLETRKNLDETHPNS